MTISEIARALGGTFEGDGSILVQSVASADQAQAGDLTFAETDAYWHRAASSAAAAVLVPETWVPPIKDTMPGRPVIRVRHVREALVRVLTMLYPELRPPQGVHPSAVVAGSAKVDSSAHVGPLCVVGERAEIGPGCVLEGGVHVGRECVLQSEVYLHPNVSLYAKTRLGNRVRVHAGTVIGSDGFGYVFHEGRHVKIPQVGWVDVHDDVEIGANVAIDRGALGPTVIGRGTKIDNLVQVAHNVVVGEHCVLVAQVGISGSTRLGNFVTLAGQVGLADHLKVGDQVIVGAKAGVMNDIPAGEKWLGAPAREAVQAKREMIAIRRLPELFQRVKDLERRLEAGSNEGR